MNDNSGKRSSSSSSSSSSSCLAITEKKSHQRPGGCIGIFFQLFDWNRRLTKKRLFSKKLLPPARANQASSKKFKGDEKMPNNKLHLIANENNGGFPSAKKCGNRVIEAEQKHEMRVPGLVARLMGLESIPSSQREKSKKYSFSDTTGGDMKESLGNHSSHTSDAEKAGVDLDMGVAKLDSRPQKLQKTGTCDRRAVTRFGSDAFQFKGVLSGARKYNHHCHHPKLPSPLKSPRITSGKSTTRSSRLIGAASKILEPGLQASSRARCFLTSSASNYPPENGIVAERVGIMSEDTKFQGGYEVSAANSLMGHTSCRNCGNLLDVVDCRPQVEEQLFVPPPVVSDVFDASSLVIAQKRRSFMPCHEQDVVLLRSQEKIISVANEEEGKSDEHSRTELTARRIPLNGESPTKWSSSCQSSRSLEDEDASFAFKHKTQAQEHMLCRERISSGSTISNMQAKRVSSAASTASGAKDFVALNRSLSGQTRMRSPARVDSSKFEVERKPCNRQYDSLSRVRNLERKRRTPNVSQVEGPTASVNSVTVRQRNLSSDAQGGRRRDLNSSPNSSNVKSRRVGQQKSYKVNENKVNEAVSLTINSPFKEKIVIPGGKEETNTGNGIKTFFQRPPPLRADAISAFLEKKLKELSSIKDEELCTGGPSKRSSALILQELISALSSERLTICDDLMFNDKHELSQERLSETSCNGNHLSPGSVLQASFSSSSLDESSGHGFHPDCMNCSCDQLEQLDHDAELLDSATSHNKGNLVCEILTELINQIPRILQSLNSFGTRLTKSNLSHMKDVIMNAELVLGNATDHSKDGVPQLLVSHIILDGLDTVTGDAMWVDFNGFTCCENSKDGGLLKGFIFDCVIEYLESNFCQHYNSVIKVWSAWTKLPLCMRAEMLVQEVKREIKKWACMAGMLPDEIIEWEMSHSLGKWTDFNIEAFEAGVDIDGEVLQILVDEIVEELVDTRHGNI